MLEPVEATSLASLVQASRVTHVIRTEPNLGHRLPASWSKQSRTKASSACSWKQRLQMEPRCKREGQAGWTNADLKHEKNWWARRGITSLDQFISTMLYTRLLTYICFTLAKLSASLIGVRLWLQLTIKSFKKKWNQVPTSSDYNLTLAHQGGLRCPTKIT